MTPSEVNKSNEDLVLRALFKQSREKKSTVKFQVGDGVRITSYKHTFNKYDSNWTREIIITDILKTRPITYKIKDLNEEQIIAHSITRNCRKLPFRGVMLQS